MVIHTALAQLLYSLVTFELQHYKPHYMLYVWKFYFYFIFTPETPPPVTTLSCLVSHHKQSKTHSSSVPLSSSATWVCTRCRCNCRFFFPIFVSSNDRLKEFSLLCNCLERLNGAVAVAAALAECVRLSAMATAFPLILTATIFRPVASCCFTGLPVVPTSNGPFCQVRWAHLPAPLLRHTGFKNLSLNRLLVNGFSLHCVLIPRLTLSARHVFRSKCASTRFSRLERFLLFSANHKAENSSHPGVMTGRNGLRVLCLGARRRIRHANTTVSQGLGKKVRPKQTGRDLTLGNWE